MTFLKKLLQENRTYEVREIVQNFPKKYDKMLRQLWGSPNLQWHGKPILGDDDNCWYEQFETAARAVFEDHRIMAKWYEIKIRDAQECYLGYDPKDDSFWIGFDMWGDDEDLQRQFDDDHRDQSEDDQNTEWKNMTGGKNNDSNNAGGLFHIQAEGRGLRCTHAIVKGPQLFYGGIYGKETFKKLGLVDLRLD